MPEGRAIAAARLRAIMADIAAYLGDCPVVVGEGRQYPVEIVYEPRSEHRPWPGAAAAAAERLLDRTDGAHFAAGLEFLIDGIRTDRGTATTTQ